MGTFLQEATLPFTIFHSQWGQPIKERIFFLWRKFFPLRADPILEMLHHPGKKLGSQRLSPLTQWADNYGEVSRIS